MMIDEIVHEIRPSTYFIYLLLQLLLPPKVLITKVLITLLLLISFTFVLGISGSCGHPGDNNNNNNSPKAEPFVSASDGEV